MFPFPASKRDALGNILASCRDEGKDPALVFSMICFDEKVLCMCQAGYFQHIFPVTRYHHFIRTMNITLQGQIYSSIRPY